MSIRSHLERKTESEFRPEKSEQYFAVMRSADDPQAFDVMRCRNAQVAVTCARALRRMEHIDQMKFPNRSTDSATYARQLLEMDAAKGIRLAKGADTLSEEQAALLYQLVEIETDLLVTDVSGETIRGYVRLSHRPTESGICDIWIDAFSEEASALAPIVDEIDASTRKSVFVSPSNVNLN